MSKWAFPIIQKSLFITTKTHQIQNSFSRNKYNSMLYTLVLLKIMIQQTAGFWEMFSYFK